MSDFKADPTETATPPSQEPRRQIFLEEPKPKILRITKNGPSGNQSTITARHSLARAIKYAEREAKRKRDCVVRPEYLLIGMVEEQPPSDHWNYAGKLLRDRIQERVPQLMPRASPENHTQRLRDLVDFMTDNGTHRGSILGVPLSDNLVYFLLKADITAQARQMPAGTEHVLHTMAYDISLRSTTVHKILYGQLLFRWDTFTDTLDEYIRRQR